MSNTTPAIAAVRAQLGYRKQPAMSGDGGTCACHGCCSARKALKRQHRRAVRQVGKLLAAMPDES